MSVSQHVRDAISDLETALSIIHRMLPAPSTLRRLQPSGDPGCQSCRRIKDHEGKPYFNETEKRDDGQRHLCRWCRRQLEGFRDDWVAEHPGETPPSGRYFWPPLCAVEWRRDNDGKHSTPSLWIEWRAAKRAERKRRRKAS